MRKTLTIIRREFLVRLRSKGFIIATLLGPLAMALLMAAPLLLMLYQDEDGEKTIVVVDETGTVFEQVDIEEGFQLTRADAPLDTLRQQLLVGEIDGILILPANLMDGSGKPTFFSQGGGGLSFRFELEAAIDRAVRNQRLIDSGAPEIVLGIMKEHVSIDMQRVSSGGEARRDDTSLMSVVGYLMGVVIYLSIFIYGSLVMRGVIEEKTSRIMEVVVSSARPFQLMLGKVLGIGALGLVQMAIWLTMTAAFVAFGGAIAASFMDPAALNLPASAPPEEILAAADIPMPSIPGSLFVYFLLFFVGGFLLYAAMFAAVGSAVDQETDAQQFVLPVALPVILAVLFVGLVVDQPDSSLAVSVSLIPLFSPILMMVRLAVTNVPFWQALLSLLLLAVFVVGTIWLASRVYRVGILMYGKKPSFGDLIRWIRIA